MMGVVYEAHDTLLDRVVALKCIRLAFDVSEDERRNFEERFFTEARSAGRLSHPGIVVVHDVGRDPESGILFMALERIEGQPLSQLYSEGAPMEWRTALRIVARVASALHHAHSAGVVHRDVKPANIMVLESGEPKVMDFGVAKLEASQAKLTSTGQFFGTPLYMSPEQALERPLDGRSDLFALGAVAYELLTGRRAFGGDSVPVILARVVTDHPMPPSLLNPELPPGADEIVTRALAKQPIDRYRDGQMLAEDVADVLDGRLPRHRAAPVAADGGGGASAGHGSPSGDDLEAAFATLVPDSPPVTVPPATQAPAERSRATPPASGWRALGCAVGLGTLIGGTALGWFTLGGRSGSAPAPATATAPGTAGGEAPPPTTLAASQTQLLARAIAARMSGDLETALQHLDELLRQHPGLEAALALRERVEAERWARQALPLEYGARHNHRIGSCQGRLSLEASGISYVSRDHGRWSWGFAEIEEMSRKGRRELELVTQETEALRLGGSKRYRFELTGGSIEREDWEHFVQLSRAR